MAILRVIFCLMLIAKFFIPVYLKIKSLKKIENSLTR